MEQNQAKINEIARKLGSLLLDKGLYFLRASFQGLPVVVYSAGDVKDFTLKAGLNIPLNQFDWRYYTTNWENWQLLIDSVILDKALYIAEKRDCDNFAFLMTSLSSFIMGLNTCGAAYGVVYNKDTGATIGGHYFNTILTSDGSLYLIDTLNSYPDFVKIEKGKPIVLGNWRYEVKGITFF
jgi:hypothetical protein